MRTLLIRSFLVATCVLAFGTLGSATASAAVDKCVPQTSPSAAYNDGYGQGCKRGSMDWSNYAGWITDCGGTWLSASSFNSNASDQSNWSTACKTGYPFGRDTVLKGANGVLATNNKTISGIASQCAGLPGAAAGGTQFIAGCQTGYVGRLNGYLEVDGLVCQQFSVPNSQAGCTAGYQQAATDIAASAITPPPPPPSAITPPPPPASAGNVPSTVPEVIQLIKRLTNWMFTIFLLLAVIMIIYAAFLYLTSGGGEEVGKAHKMLLYAAIAIAVASLAQGLVTVVQRLVTG